MLGALREGGVGLWVESRFGALRWDAYALSPPSAHRRNVCTTCRIGVDTVGFVQMFQVRKLALLMQYFNESSGFLGLGF